MDRLTRTDSSIRLRLQKHPDSTLIVCSIDSHVDEEGNIVPGLGKFYERYQQYIDEEREAARTVVRTVDEPSHRPESVLIKKRKGWRRYLLFGPRAWELGEVSDSSASP